MPVPKPKFQTATQAVHQDPVSEPEKFDNEAPIAQHVDHLKFVSQSGFLDEERLCAR